jgi:sec-independent protein translocase protein TatA
MGSFSIWHWLIVIAVLLLLFGGRGRVSNLMGDLAKGVKAFKTGMKDEQVADGPQPDVAPKRIPAETAAPASQPERDPAQH